MAVRDDSGEGRGKGEQRGPSVCIFPCTCWCPCAPGRYTALAQALVLGAWGTPRDRGWRLPNNKLGSGDDISVFIIPLGGPGTYS